jgi:hypothetical protein
MKKTDLIYTGVAIAAAYLIYSKFIKKPSENENFSSASGRTRRRPSIQKAGGSKMCNCVNHSTGHKIQVSCPDAISCSTCCENWKKPREHSAPHPY